jgi:hypothetical protein
MNKVKPILVYMFMVKGNIRPEAICKTDNIKSQKFTVKLRNFSTGFSYKYKHAALLREVFITKAFKDETF